MLRMARRGLAPAALDDVDAVASAPRTCARRARRSTPPRSPTRSSATSSRSSAARASCRASRSGASPRAAVHLLGAAKAAARLAGRAYVTPDDVARMAAPVLRHRLVLTPEAELERATPAGAIRTALEDVAGPPMTPAPRAVDRPRGHRRGGAARPARARRARGARAGRGGRRGRPRGQASTSGRPSESRGPVARNPCTAHDSRASSRRRDGAGAPARAAGAHGRAARGRRRPQRPARRHPPRPAHAARRWRPAATGPLGLARWDHAAGPDLELRVFPDLKTARRLALAVARGRFRDQGATARGPLGLGTEFELIRDYQPDDDIRQVNWRATARLGRPMSNQYRLEQDRDLLLLLDAGRLSAAPLGEAERARRLPRRRRRAGVRRRRARRPHRRRRVRRRGPDRAQAAPGRRAGGRARALRPAAAPARQRLRARLPPRRGLQARARRRLRRPARGGRRAPAGRGRPRPVAAPRGRRRQPDRPRAGRARRGRGSRAA